MPDDKVKAYDRHGEKITIDRGEIGKLYALGGKLATKAEIEKHTLEADYAKRTTGEKIIGALSGAELPPALQAFREGGTDTLTMGAHKALARQAADYVSPGTGARYEKRIDSLAEAFPEETTAGNAAGFIGQMAVGSQVPIPGGAAAAGVGAKVAARLGATEATALGRAAISGAKLGAQGLAEGGAIGGAQYATEAQFRDHDMEADKLFSAVGTGALYGGGAGAALGGTGSLLASAGRSVRGSIAEAMARRGTPGVEEAAVPRGAPVSLSAEALDAGIGQKVAAESPFDFAGGLERRPVQLRPDVAQRGGVATENAVGFAKNKPLSIEDLFTAQGERPPSVTINPDAGLGSVRRGAAGRLEAQGAVEATDALKLSSAKTVPRDVMLRDGIEATEAAAAGAGPINIPGAPAAPGAAAPGLIASLGTEGGVKGLAYDRAWSSLGGGFGLQSTTFAQRAAKYLPNKTRDVGEWMMRKGIINPEMGALDLAKGGTPEKMLPAIRAANEATGARIGELTGASGGHISADEVMRAINEVAGPLEARGATRPAAAAVRDLGEAVLDSLGANKGKSAFAVQEVLAERRAIDDVLFDTARINPKLGQQMKQELRGKLEGLVVNSLDEASGRLKGDLATEYKALKKDYLAGMIAQEAAEDSANRAAKAGFLGLKDLTFGGGSIIKSVGSKLVRERGDAVAAAMLYQEAERGNLAKWMAKVDDQIGKASKGLIAPPAKGVAKASETMPPSKTLARTAMMRVAEFQADPEAYVEKATRQTEALSVHSPEVAAGLVSRQVQGLAFLAEKVPVTPDPDPLDPHPAPKMTSGEQHELARYAWYVEKPSRFFSEVARGKVTFEGAETAQRLMPRAFESLQQQTMEALATQMARGNKLPYRQRQMIGVLMDVAATPSQRPDHAAFLQQNVLPLPEETPAAPAKRPSATTQPQRSALDRLEADGPGKR